MHGHAQGHHSPAAETVALLALFGGPGDDAAGNIATWDQVAGTPAVTTGAPASVTDPASTLFRVASGKFKVVAFTSGALNALATSGTAQLQSSIDAPHTAWVTQKTVELPAVTAGAAATVATALAAVVDLSASIGVPGVKFRLLVTLAGGGGTYTTLISEGGVIAQELPF